MSRSRLRRSWGQTAAIVAMLYNAHRDPANSQYRAAWEFNPYSEPSVIKPISLRDLHAMTKGVI